MKTTLRIRTLHLLLGLSLKSVTRELRRSKAGRVQTQWTVSGQFRALRPLMKYSWPDGEQVYVSTVTGEVAQYTIRSDRIFAHLGPIPHWQRARVRAPGTASRLTS